MLLTYSLNPFTQVCCETTSFKILRVINKKKRKVLLLEKGAGGEGEREFKAVAKPASVYYSSRLPRVFIFFIFCIFMQI